MSVLEKTIIWTGPMYAYSRTDCYIICNTRSQPTRPSFNYNINNYNDDIQCEIIMFL